MGDLFRDTGATFSPCKTWRYRLWRIWDASLPLLAMGMLNPSDANADKNDPTVERVERRARMRFFGGVVVFNAHGYVETYPAEMKKRLAEGFDIVGPENVAHIRAILDEVTRAGGTVCVGWGADGGLCGQDRVISKMADEMGIPLYCLRTTASGQPGHPLYVPYEQALQPWIAP